MKKIIFGLGAILLLIFILSIIMNADADLDFLKGDINKDAKIDIFDLAAVGLAFGSESGDESWNPNADIANTFGKIDVFDLATVGKNFGAHKEESFYLDEICSSHSYWSCYGNDVYWYDSCDNREEKKEDCGEDYCEEWGDWYCRDNSLFHKRTCHSKGCFNDACFDNAYIEEERIQEMCSNECLFEETRCSNNYKQTCGNYDMDCCLEWPPSTIGEGNEYCEYGCENGECNLLIECYKNSDCGTDDWIGQPTCQNDDVFQDWRTYKCENPGTPQASCSYTDSLKLREDCGEDYCEAWQGNYCKNDDVYHKRDCYDKRCSGGSCFNDEWIDEQIFRDCKDGCSDGYCIRVVDISEGVSLFSLPVVPATSKSFNQLNSDCEVVYNGWTSECDEVNLASFNPSTKDYECLDLDDVLYPGQGYFIKVEDDCSFSVAGNDLMAGNIGYLGSGIIRKGENLIGSLTEPIEFLEIKGDCEIREEPLVFVYGVTSCEGVSYYTGTHYCTRNSPEINFCYCSVSSLQPGFGYNVYSNNECSFM